MDIQKAVAEYQVHLAWRGYAGRSVERYLETLKPFVLYLAECGVDDPAQVTREMLREYQVVILERKTKKDLPLSLNTRNSYLRGVKQLFAFLSREGYRAGDPGRDLMYAREPRTLPRSILTEKEVKKVLAAPDTTTHLGYRDRAILEVLYSTGIRNGEARRLKVADVDYEGGFVRVESGKGNKDRVVPLGRSACHWVENYVKGVRPVLARRDLSVPWLFLTVRGGMLARLALVRVVRQWAGKAGLEKRVTPHTFRHTCATLMMKNKANLRHVQELLGHARLDTTQVYLAVTAADLKEAHRKYHPSERERRRG